MGRTMADDIGDDLREIVTDADDFGGVVTHVPRGRPSFDVNGVFQQNEVTTGLTDTRKGRENPGSAMLLISDVDAAGGVVVVDDEGEFVIHGARWNVTNVAGVRGGFLVTLHVVDRKTLRRMTGNS